MAPARVERNVLSWASDVDQKDLVTIEHTLTQVLNYKGL